MKKFSLTSLLIIITLGFSSCSVEEDPILDEPTGRLYEKVTVKRDANGAYSWDIDLNEGADAEIVDNKMNNGKDVYLYSSGNSIQKRLNEDIVVGKGDKFSVGVKNTHNNSRSILTVKDKDIKFSRSVQDDHLSEYKMTDNGDGTYDLDFTVDPNIEVDFILNEDSGVYEIHLEPGEGEQSDFNRTFVRESGTQLKIAFVNYFYNRGARNAVSKSTKPEVWVED